MKKILIKLAGAMLLSLTMISCSKEHMENVNIDQTKPSTLDPNAQLTTALLQTYGDFGLMDTYRCYITGFTQHFSGGWNVSNYAGAVHADNEMMRKIWDRYYAIGIKNLVDGISRTEDRPVLNAVLRIHRVYMLSVLTDTYGDIPCSEAGLGYVSGIANPKYDQQKDIYDWFFTELDACITQISQNEDLPVTGDVTSLGGDPAKWMRYANSLRMRFAMRISDVNSEKAQEEFSKSLAAGCGYIASAGDNAYIKYLNVPFNLYEGANELDFRANALGEMLYGQDSDSPTFICATFFDWMKGNNDPRLYRICRHYLNPKRSQIEADDAWNVDVTDEVVAYQNSDKGQLDPNNKFGYACNVGAAWYHNWINAPANEDIPTLAALVAQYPEAGFDGSNYPARMMRPFLSIKLEKAECPGVLMTSAEVNFLIAEALSKGWSLAGVSGTVSSYYEAGVRESMQMLNDYYDINKISDSEISDYIAAHPVGDTAEQQKENINTQAWVLHLMNPSEAWANLRRSDYPVLEDRSKYDLWTGDFTYDDENLQTPVRLPYPALEAMYNKDSYKAALDRLGGKDDWHKRLWWDTADIHVKYKYE